MALTQVTSSMTQEIQAALVGNNIDLATGSRYFTKTMNASIVFTVSNVPTTGAAISITLDLTNGGKYPITWWSGVRWSGGVAPTLSAGRDVLEFSTYDGGTTWAGLVLAKNVSLYSPWTIRQKSNPSLTLVVAYQAVMVDGVYYVGGQGGAIVNSKLGYSNFTVETLSGLVGSPNGINYTTGTSNGIRYVACTTSGGLYYSNNFVTWTAATSGVTTNLNYVAADTSRFVVTGQDGTLLTSQDGVTWTTASAAGALASVLIGCIWTPTTGLWVAVGTNVGATAGAILTSTTGTSFTARTSGTANALNGIVWTGSKYLVVGNTGTILTSTDGITWTTVTSGTTANLVCIAISSDGTTVVAAGASGTVIRSTDAGVTWGAAITVGVNSNSYRSCTWVGDRFVITSVAGAADISFSYDGVQWYFGMTGRGSTAYSLGYNASADTYLVPTYGQAAISTVGSGGALWRQQGISTLGVTNFVRGAAYSPPLGAWFVGVRFGEVLYSTDNGVTWISSGSTDLGNDAYGLVWGNNLAVVCDAGGGGISTSTDLVTWTYYTYGTDSGYSIAYANSLYVMPSASTAGRISYSSTALSGSWTAVNSGTGQIMKGVCWTGSLWVCVGALGTIATSPDAITWTVRTSGVTNDLNCVAAQSSSILYAGGARATIIKSTDGGTTWAREILPVGVFPSSIGFFGMTANANRVVASGSIGSVGCTIIVRS